MKQSMAIPRVGLFSHRYIARDILRGNVMKDFGDASSPVFKAIRENDAFRGWKPDFQMRIVHCEKDDVVPANTEFIIGPARFYALRAD